MIFLDVPFRDKEQVKSLGAKFNYVVKKWYIPDGISTDLFLKWVQGETIEQNHIITPNVTQDNNEQTSLAKFLSEVSYSISKNFPKTYKIACEIGGCKKYPQGNWYLELTEHNTAGVEIAKINSIIWRDNLRIVKKFEESTGIQLEAGIKILVEATIESSPKYGLSLIIKNIDPSYTMGEMLLKIKEIKDKLSKEGIVDLNKNIKLPQDFLNILVISPQGAAGLADFKSDAQILETNNVCSFTYVEALFEGEKASQSIANSFIKATTQFDAVCFIRGGGAKSSLNWLNDYQIAKQVCRCPIPILAGIGHNTDHTVIDELVSKSFDTPSKVINFIFSTLHSNKIEADRSLNNIKLKSYNITTKHKEQVNYIINNIITKTTQAIAIKRIMQKNIFSEIKINLKNNLTNEKEKLKSIIQQIMALNPEKILGLGYAIVRDENETPITSNNKFNPKKQFSITWKDGKSTVNKE